MGYVKIKNSFLKISDKCRRQMMKRRLVINTWKKISLTWVVPVFSKERQQPDQVTDALEQKKIPFFQDEWEFFDN